MERRLSPLRRTGLAAVLLLVVSLTAACSGSGPVGRTPAATVGDQTISVDTLLDLVEAMADFEKVAATRSLAEDASEADREAALAQALASFQGAGTATVTTSSVASAATTHIQLRILRATAADLGVEVTEEELAAAEAELTDNLAQSQLSLDDLGRAAADLFIERNALQDAIRVHLTEPVQADEATLEALYQEQLPTLVRYCMVQVVAEDEAAVAAAGTRIAAGEDPGEVSAEVSTIPEISEAKGDAGCVGAADLVQAFGPEAAAATAGTQFDPIGSEGYSILFVVAAVEEPTLEEVAPGLLAQFEEQATQAAGMATQEAILRVGRSLNISVDPRFGTWDGETARVVAGPTVG